MPQEIPLEPGNPFYRMTTTLDGTQFIFDVHWNGRQEAWYFDISTADDVLIRGGNKIVLGTFPGRRSVDPEFPAGVFLVIDTSNQGVDATFEDIGVRVLMHFHTFDEFEALQ